MDNNKLLELIKKARTESKKRKFTQRMDLIVNLQHLDFKKPEHQVDLFLHFNHSIGKNKKVCALVGPELENEAKNSCDHTIIAGDFANFKNDKKALKALANEYDFFIAQANIMPQVAATFGRTLGPKNKMPNPKAGCVVGPKANLKPIYDRLQQTIRVNTKRELILHTCIGGEEMSDEDLKDNIETLYNQLIHHLPMEENNVKSVYIKFTMGKTVKVY